jgi:hypothetical protein
MAAEANGRQTSRPRVDPAVRQPECEVIGQCRFGPLRCNPGSANSRLTASPWIGPPDSDRTWKAVAGTPGVHGLLTHAYRRARRHQAGDDRGLGAGPRGKATDPRRTAHRPLLRIPADEIQTAVFADAGEVSQANDARGEQARKKAGRRRRGEAVPVLEAALRLLGWKDERAAAKALGTSPEQLRAWRSGSEQMAFADYMTLTSMIGVAAAQAMRGGDARIADLAAAAETFGVRSSE